MTDRQKYVADTLRTSGIGLMVSGLVGLFFQRASVFICLVLIFLGVVLIGAGYYYVNKRSKG